MEYESSVSLGLDFHKYSTLSFYQLVQTKSSRVSEMPGTKVRVQLQNVCASIFPQ